MKLIYVRLRNNMKYFSWENWFGWCASVCTVCRRKIRSVLRNENHLLWYCDEMSRKTDWRRIDYIYPFICIFPFAWTTWSVQMRRNNIYMNKNRWICTPMGNKSDHSSSSCFFLSNAGIVLYAWTHWTFESYREW